ncbi:LytR/AlgR family response regulator transcription factor [Marinigracilibium pacificum]|uniref:Response regulator transcription factor n=1 Tax=Marinigracilibium pacificum TaxID=2729599 RepID=A0A848IWG9_9BACT|nr:LytTR family DNA-binding domain-containing protein [Marinigracilibium pacificum]NMM47625.1 response regulator transcription factor [Marinigracilibium pacificum]
MSIKYIIVDDETIAHDIIKKYCGMLPNMELVQDCYDAIDALQFLHSNPVDLIFLDINMPKLKGFEFLRTLTNPPKVIVTTAYQEYALEGYELNVVDYLLKPFSFERFLKAVNKSNLSGTNQHSKVETQPEKVSPEKIFLRSNNKYIQVDPEDILYVEASGNYVKVVMKEEELTIRGTLSSVHEHIPADGFLQVHRSFIIAKKHIKSIEGNQVFMGDHVVPIGKSYREVLEKLVM